MRRHRTTSGLLAALLLFGGAAIVHGSDRKGEKPGKDKDNSYKATILVSNEDDEAPTPPDPLLVNAWGIAANAKSPWWVSNNGTGTSTLYTGDGVKQKLEVTVPGAPTGMVFNGGTQFELGPKLPAIFLWASEDGSISGWNPGFNPNAVAVIPPDPTSIYKGLAIHGDVLFTTNFGDECKVESIGGDFKEFDSAGGFKDPSIPRGYCPFGIQVVGDSVFVTYAKKKGVDDVAGVGHGFVREFDIDGNLVAHVASRGRLNSPWGMAMAPEGFGKFSGCLLVGNFGDGQVNAYCQKQDGDNDDDDKNGKWHHAGRLHQGHHILKIDGLWGIGFGNGAGSGPVNVLYFAAGPDDESNGYFGKIEFMQ